MSKLILEEITDIKDYCNMQGMVRLARVKSALKDSRITNEELIKIFVTSIKTAKKKQK